ncbi:hypothetical protein ACXR0O_19625 [Verrucomicrobiota bacterium sgz303538]
MNEPLTVLPYGIVLALLLVAAVINVRSGIIPDRLTLTGALGGIVVSWVVPNAVGGRTPLEGAGLALLGMIAGFTIAYAAVEIGKLVFGKMRLVFDSPQTFHWVREGDDAVLTIEGKSAIWSNIFARECDQLSMNCTTLEIAGDRFVGVSPCWTYNQVQVGSRKWELIKTDAIDGEITEVTIPREAIGFGIVKLMMPVGAFLGWKAAIFIFCSALCVCLLGCALIAVCNREKASASVMFAPYILVATLFWTIWQRGVLF